MATFVIVGATGDLAQRMLLPALFRLWSDGALSRDFGVLGVARRPWNDDDLRRVARAGAPTPRGPTPLPPRPPPRPLRSRSCAPWPTAACCTGGPSRGPG